MNNTGFISNLIKDSSGPFIYQDGKCILTYEELRQEISKATEINSSFKVLSWRPENNISFLVNYFSLIDNGITPILVDHRRLELSPYDYDLEKLSQAKLNGIQSHQSCASIIYTSGSTGRPKGVRLSLDSLLNSARATVNHYQINQQDNWALSLPLFHIGGIMIAWRSLVAGSSLTIVDAGQLENDLLENSQISICSLVQLQLARLMDSEQMTKRLKQLKGIVLGGSKISSALIQKATSSGIYLSNSFGASESCAQFLATPFTKDNELLSTCGKPMDGKVSIIDSKCILEGKSIAIGYLYGDDFNQKYITNDLIRLDEHGNYTILGRSDFVFQKAAENINPEIIEEKLSKHFSNAYVAPIKNDKYENLIALTFCDDHSLAQAQSIIEDELISFERPHLLYKARDLKEQQVGVKIGREKIKLLMNTLFMQFNEDIYISAQGNPHGDIIFISHGFMGNSLELEKVTKHLAKNYLLIYIDLPGHGKNHKLRSFELFKERLISSILEIDTMTNKEVHFITYSMSGRLFNEILRDKRLAEAKAIKTFVNESGAPGFTGNIEDKRKRLQHDSILFKDAQAETFFHKWYDQGVFKNIKLSPRASKMLKQKEIEFIKYAKSWSQVSKILSVANQRDLRDLNELPQGITYHYLCGEFDKKYQMYCDAYIPSDHVDFHSYIIKDASHNIHFMNEEYYLNLLKKIFKS
ncbi:alpha/beta hydrolase family protein [Bacteriovorax sp. BAL6_X]|uniref:AMP-binding protein n=1 Tax=Bacteriovorax sp. BAL6_X TaxID=1201290 RepID=UPI000385D710|nr:AMP-binding protein [Bacteriovorax sp. BAL6_X]EPZ50785.1 alpha/beta hydrolase family protein [Bacteriovorax sp. BAL6_X]